MSERAAALRYGERPVACSWKVVWGGHLALGALLLSVIRPPFVLDESGTLDARRVAAVAGACTALTASLCACGVGPYDVVRETVCFVAKAR